MIAARLISTWDSLLGSAALLAIIILGFCAMTRAVKREDVLRHLGMLAAVLILLTMLPMIIISLWTSMPAFAHIGVAMIVVVTVAVLNAAQRRSRKSRH